MRKAAVAVSASIGLITGLNSGICARSNAWSGLGGHGRIWTLSLPQVASFRLINKLGSKSCDDVSFAGAKIEYLPAAGFIDVCSEF